MKLVKTAGLSAAAGLALACAPAPAAEILKTLPVQLDAKKAYALVELRNIDDKKMKGNLVLARYDAEGGDVRGGARSPGSALPAGVPAGSPSPAIRSPRRPGAGSTSLRWSPTPGWSRAAPAPHSRSAPTASPSRPAM
jgi:hypothetical protein